MVFILGPPEFVQKIDCSCNRPRYSFLCRPAITSKVRAKTTPFRVGCAPLRCRAFSLDTGLPQPPRHHHAARRAWECRWRWGACTWNSTSHQSDLRTLIHFRFTNWLSNAPYKLQTDARNQKWCWRFLGCGYTYASSQLVQVDTHLCSLIWGNPDPTRPEKKRPGHSTRASTIMASEPTSVCDPNG